MFSRETFRFTKSVLFIHCIIVVFISFSSMANELLSKEQFVAKALAFKQQSMPESTHIVLNDTSIKTTNPDGGEHFSFLDNAYAIYQNNPGDLDKVLKQFLSTDVLPSKAELPLAKKLKTIMPVLKDDGYINNLKAMMLKKAPDAPLPLYYESLNNGLNIVYVFDSEQSMQFVSEANVVEMGLNSQELKSIALDNLAIAIPKLSISGDTSFVSYLIADSNYEASFLLVDSLWTKQNFPVKGDIVVYAISRDTVLVTGSKDSEGITAILNLVNQSDIHISHALATTGLIRNGNNWSIFEHDNRKP